MVGAVSRTIRRKQGVHIGSSFPNFSTPQNYLKGSLNITCWATSTVSDPAALERDPRTCISNKFPDYTSIAGLGTSV